MNGINLSWVHGPGSLPNTSLEMSAFKGGHAWMSQCQEWYPSLPSLNHLRALLSTIGLRRGPFLAQSDVRVALSRVFLKGGFPGDPVVETPRANAGTQVWPLVWKDSICCRTTPMYHNYWSQSTSSLCPAARETTTVRSLHTSTKSSPSLTQLEKALM